MRYNIYIYERSEYEANIIIRNLNEEQKDSICELIYLTNYKFYIEKIEEIDGV